MSTEQPAPSGPAVSAGLVVGDYLAVHLAALLDGDRALRDGDRALGRGEETVHATRVAVRRVRSILRVYDELFEPGPAEHLDGELRWWAGILGPVRDLQVLQARLDAMVDDADEGPVLRSVKVLIDDELERDRREHWAQVGQAITSDRYRALLDEAARWGARPPWTTKAHHPAAALATLVQRTDELVARRLERANRSGDIDQLHGARKAAKRARYSAEAAAPVLGTRAVKQAKRYQELQDLLGEHRDSIVSTELLKRLAAQPDSLAAEQVFGLGLLYDKERRRGRKALRSARRLAHRYR